MKNHDTTPPISKSGKEVAKMSSKFSRDYWRSRVYHPTYMHDGREKEVPEFWARVQHASRREAIGLGTNDREEAARKAAKFYSRVKAAGWTAALADFSPDRDSAKGTPTVGEVIDAAMKSARESLDAPVRENSLRGYVVCFRRLASEAYGVRATDNRFDYRTGGNEAWRKRVDKIRMDKLTPAKIKAALSRRIRAANGNPLDEQKARTTCASLLRQAKALFAPDRKLPFENLPNPFQGVSVEVGTPAGYKSTIKAPALLQQAKAELATPTVYTEPPKNDADQRRREYKQSLNTEAYKALLLALGAGLRASEIDNLQWQQIDAKANKVRIMTTATFATKTESSEREVYVDAGLVAELEKYRDKASALYVLESDQAPKPGAAVASYRAETTFNHLKKWLRAHGIKAHKPIHTLRKEFGSLVCEASDIFTASRQLGHATIALTATYYTENRKQVAPAIGAMLNPPQPEQKGAKA